MFRRHNLVTLAFAVSTMGLSALSIWSANGWPLGFWPLVILETFTFTATIYRLVTPPRACQRTMRRTLARTERTCRETCSRLGMG